MCYDWIMTEKIPGFNLGKTNEALNREGAENLTAEQAEYRRKQRKYMAHILEDILEEDVARGSVPFESTEEYENELSFAVAEEDVEALSGLAERLAEKIQEDAIDEDFFVTLDRYIAMKRLAYGGDQIPPDKEEALLKIRRSAEEIFNENKQNGK